MYLLSILTEFFSKLETLCSTLSNSYLKLKRFAMNLWKHYVYTQKEQRRKEKEKTERAIQFYQNRNLAIAFNSWQVKATEQKKRKKQAKIKIAKIWCMKLAKVKV